MSKFMIPSVSSASFRSIAMGALRMLSSLRLKNHSEPSYWRQGIFQQELNYEPGSRGIGMGALEYEVVNKLKF